MIPECRHIRPNGTKCQAAALRNNSWCYFHDNHQRERRAAAHQPAATLTLDHGHMPVPCATQFFILDLPLIEDRSSIQLSIARVLHALASNQLDTKRAGLLLYGLQIAARNLPEHELGTYGTVTDIAHTYDGTPYDATGLAATRPATRLETPPEDPDEDEEEGDEGEDPDDDEEEDQDEEEDRHEDEADDSHDETSKAEYPQSLKDLQLFVARLRVAALRQGMDPAIVNGPYNSEPNLAPAPLAR